jgi:hypothetical protein
MTDPVRQDFDNATQLAQLGQNDAPPASGWAVSADDRSVYLDGKRIGTATSMAIGNPGYDNYIEYVPED